MNKMKFILSTFLLAVCSLPIVSKASNVEAFAASGPTLQVIQITNLLANKDLPTPGMTETAVVVSFYNGGQRDCWSTKVEYQNDYTFRAATGLGCATKATRVVIQPIATGGKINAYSGPYTINIDTTKFAAQIILVQDQPPVFDPQTGLVTTPGTMKAKMQAQLQ